MKSVFDILKCSRVGCLARKVDLLVINDQIFLEVVIYYFVVRSLFIYLLSSCATLEAQKLDRQAFL